MLRVALNFVPRALVPVSMGLGGPPKCMKPCLGNVAQTLVSAASRRVSTLFGSAPGPEHRGGFSTLPHRHSCRRGQALSPTKPPPWVAASASSVRRASNQLARVRIVHPVAATWDRPHGLSLAALTICRTHRSELTVIGHLSPREWDPVKATSAPSPSQREQEVYPLARNAIPSILTGGPEIQIRTAVRPAPNRKGLARGRQPHRL